MNLRPERILHIQIHRGKRVNLMVLCDFTMKQGVSGRRSATPSKLLAGSRLTKLTFYTSFQPLRLVN